MESSQLEMRRAAVGRSRTELCSLVDFCSTEDRVCPAPSAWHRLWRMLPADAQGRTARHPPSYFDCRDAAADNELKWALVDHLLWAEQAGALRHVDRYLRSLPPGQWWLKSLAC